MQQRFATTVQLAPAELNTATPLGLFRVTSGSTVAHFLIVEADERRLAILLDSEDERNAFVVWPLQQDDPAAWGGISLGPVEVLVDESAAHYTPGVRSARGEVSLTDGKVYLGARYAPQQGATLFEVATCAAGGTGCVSFTRWQLVQRDHFGSPIALFEHGS